MSEDSKAPAATRVGLWSAYKKSRQIRIDLDKLDPMLKGYYVIAMPTSAYEPSVGMAMEAIRDTTEQNYHVMGLWIEEWNLVDNNGEILPIPRDDPPVYENVKKKGVGGVEVTEHKKVGGGKWADTIPFEVQTFIIKQIGEVDKERLSVPTENANS